MKKILVLSAIFAMIVGVWLLKKDHPPTVSQAPISNTIESTSSDLNISDETALPKENINIFQGSKTASDLISSDSTEDAEAGPLTSSVLGNYDKALINHNIDAVGLSPETSQILNKLVQEKTLLEKTLGNGLRNRSQALNSAFLAVRDGTATEEQIASVEQFKQEAADIANEYRQKKRAFDDSLESLLTNQQKQRLEEYEKPIVREKVRDSIDSFLDTVLGYLPNVEDHQRDFASTISDTVLASGDEQYYSLGATLQAADTSSPSFKIDDTKPIIAASRYLDQVLTPEQRRLFDASKLVGLEQQ